MGKFEIDLNSNGIRELLRSVEIQAELQRQAEKYREKLGDKFETDVYVGPGRANASVFTTDPEAIRENEQTNSMLKAMGVSPPAEAKTGKWVEGHYRTLKDGRKIWVSGYQRRK